MLSLLRGGVFYRFFRPLILRTLTLNEVKGKGTKDFIKSFSPSGFRMSSRHYRKTPRLLSLLTWAENYLNKNHIGNPRLEAEFLLTGFLGCSKLDLYLDKIVLDENNEEALRELIMKRSQGIPSQILLGHTQFMDWNFLVQKGIFIPRQDSEVLVETAYQIIEQFSLDSASNKILDLGTGSGNIAISLAKKFPKIQLYALDKSSRALSLAKKNAQLLGVEKRIFFYQGDLLSALKKMARPERFSLITANLPYISRANLSRLPVEVRNFDPIQSLDGGKDGLRLYRRLVSQAWRYLEPPGFLILEIGEGQAGEVKKMVGATQKYDSIRIIQDYRGKERVVVIRRN